ncbi:MAG: hypothetical protein HY308_02250 [Gammaproteobacteria bacterium]|nr:hypothetical protein [Gammaproteobacteria bacterium]
MERRRKVQHKNKGNQLLQRYPNTTEVESTSALERALETLRQTEQAFASLCEELLKERRRTAEAVRCLKEYRRLYLLARASAVHIAQSAAQPAPLAPINRDAALIFLSEWRREKQRHPPLAPEPTIRR